MIVSFQIACDIVMVRQKSTQLDYYGEMLFHLVIHGRKVICFLSRRTSF